MLGNRLLLVDDDGTVLMSLAAILSRHGFDVVPTRSVAEAIRAITSQTFDILVTDLNIGEPGDGFTVVSALRRIQPKAAALIITGFPAFDTALQAIRDQVDDYLVKPIPPPDLLSAIERLRATREKHVPLQTKRAYEIVRENIEVLRDRWLARVQADADAIGRSDLDNTALLDHVIGLIKEICNRAAEQRTFTLPDAKKHATAHGLLRRQQNLDPVFIMHEGTHIRQEVLGIIHTHLLTVNLSFLFTDLVLMSDSLDDQLKLSMEARMSGAAVAS